MKVSVLGCRIDATPSYKITYQKVKAFLRESALPAYITVNNVHTVVEGTLKPRYKSIINNAWMAFPDGKPLSVVMGWKGVKDVERIFGPTFFEKTLEWGRKDGLKHFFFGSSEETLGKLVAACRKRFPGAEIVGQISPPFRPLTDEENVHFVKEMNESGADIIWVAFGAPKQEIWMAENFRGLERGVMIGIGAGFDYIAGNTTHAPEWMKRYALEWLYRLIQEPGRLWKRYLVTNSLFILFTAMERLGLKKFE